MDLWLLVVIVLGAALVLGFGIVIARGRHDAVRGSAATLPSADPSDMDATVRRLVDDGRLIQAIKVVRERTGMRLAAAKRYVDLIAAGESAEAARRATQSGPLMVSVPGDTLERIRDLAARGHTVQAIKELREHTDLSLEDAKAIVDGL